MRSPGQAPDLPSKTVGARTIMTVLGPMDAERCGICLVHEHVLFDLRCYQQDGSDAGPLSIEQLGAARRDFSRFPDNMVLDDVQLAKDELRQYVDFGGRSIVDGTPIGLRLKGAGTHPLALRALAEATGLNIIASCGYYVESSHPPEVASASVGQLADIMISEIIDGIDGTDVKAGMIGEIGLSQPIRPNELRVLQAACQAQLATGVGLQIHPYFGAHSRIAPEATRFILREGVDPRKVSICHMDGNMRIDYQRRVLDMGVSIQFDNFGLETYFDSLDFNHNCHDSQREAGLVALLDLGYEDQVMLSHDVCTKVQLVRYGGYGYAHLLRDILPSLRHRGLDDRTLNRILMDNPREFLAVAG